MLICLKLEILRYKFYNLYFLNIYRKNELKKKDKLKKKINFFINQFDIQIS